MGTVSPSLFHKMNRGQIQHIDGVELLTRQELTHGHLIAQLLYVQDAAQQTEGNAFGLNCPNCGAPMKGLGQQICEYCGSPVVPVDTRVWRMVRFSEVDYHHV